MSKITFSEDKVMPNQLANKTGNLSQTLFNKNSSQTKIVGIGSELEKTNPYSWNSQQANDVNMTPSGLPKQFNMFMDQANLAEYYQHHPMGILEHSKKYGYKGPVMGGDITKESPF